MTSLKQTKSHEPVRQATYADIPRLVEMSAHIYSVEGQPRDPNDIAAHFASHIGRVGCVVLISEHSFAIGIHTHAVNGEDTTLAAFTTAWAEDDDWADLVWAADAWAESMGASELRFGLLSEQSKAKEEITAQGFGLHSVFMARPVDAGTPTRKDIEQ